MREVPITVAMAVKPAAKTTAITNHLVATIRIKIRVYFALPVRKVPLARPVLSVRRVQWDFPQNGPIADTNIGRLGPSSFNRTLLFRSAIGVFLLN